MPALKAAFIPALESSITIHSFGFIFSFSAAFKNISGFGFVSFTSSLHTMALKKASILAFFNCFIALSFTAEVANAILKLFSLKLE